MNYTLGMIDGCWWGIFRTRGKFQETLELPHIEVIAKDGPCSFTAWGDSRPPWLFMEEESILIEDGTLEELVAILSTSRVWEELLQRLMAEEV